MARPTNESDCKEEKSQPAADKMLDSKSGINLWWLSFLSIVLANFWTRFYQVDKPAWVCWDETHFGKMGSWYINRTFFFDVHPPLGKMFIGAVGYLTGYNGTFPFEKPGELYHDHNYVGMRVACTFLGACLTPFSFLTVWELTGSLVASSIAGILVVFDVGMLTLNRYILLDPILLFFISGATYAMVKFRNVQTHFSLKWWCCLTLTGIMIAGAISVKFVGLFVVLLVGCSTAHNLWEIMGDLSKPIFYTVKHFFARALCLIALPIALYVFFFYIHLKVLYKTGNGDGHFSSSFQTALEGNPLHNASMPRFLSIGSIATLKNHRTGGGYLHSHFHLYPEGIGARQQQVTTYAHKDENNKFVIKSWNEEPPAMYSEEWEKQEEVQYVKHGDLIRLEHFQTKRNIHSHQEAAPITKKFFQVTGYGENGQGDANDVWRVEIVGGKEGDVVETVTTKFKLHHYFLKCVLTTSTKQLPKWAFEQQEVACNPSSRDLNSLWNIEDNFNPKMENISLQMFSPSFLSRFIESHAVMLQGNAGLKPKEGEYTSKPWEWPINLRGQFFSGNDHRVYLLGNPVIWWSNISLLSLFMWTCVYTAIRYQRGYEDSDEIKEKKEKSIYAGLWLVLGWGLHYIPFWSMGRVLYFHHYFPALLYSNMLSAVIIDYTLALLTQMVPKNWSNTVFHTLLGSIIGIVCYSFYLFSPLAYGMDETPGHMTNSSVHHLKWVPTWEF